MQTRTVLTIAATALALGFTGCGDDDPDESLTVGEYIDLANASCVEAEGGAIEAYERIIGEGRPTPAEAQRFLQEAVVPALRDGFAVREALPAPEGDETEIAAINAAGQEALAGFERIAADPEMAHALMLGQLPDPATEVDRLNGEYGIDECSGGN